MTDDFQLFPDPAGDPVDADIALITAYLARELSPVQIVAVEDRLAKDPEFQANVRQVIAAWTLPARIGAPVFAGAEPLSKAEVEAGWRRYVDGRAEVDAHDGPRLVVDAGQPKRRKISMTRIAAGIAAITLPIVTLAQVAIYVAKRPEAPGHALAKDIVAPFTNPAPESLQPVQPEKPLPPPEDVRIGRQLEKPTPQVQRSAPVQVPSLGAAVPASVPKPDRAKIAALATRHMGHVVRGDTVANYIVMVLDARGDYVWGTYGYGSAMVEITGDTRPFAARLAFLREHATEYTGYAPGARGGGGRGAVARAGGGAGFGRGTGARARGSVRDSSAMRPGDTLVTIRRSPGDSSRIVARGIAGAIARIDSIRVMSGVAGTDSTARPYALARGIRGSAASTTIGDMIASDSAGTRYRLGFGWMSNGEYVNVNEAPGLQQPGNGESGVQGLKSASVMLGESYQFVAGQLSPTGLRIFVLHLAPGVNWRGR